MESKQALTLRHALAIAIVKSRRQSRNVWQQKAKLLQQRVEELESLLGLKPPPSSDFAPLKDQHTTFQKNQTGSMQDALCSTENLVPQHTTLDYPGNCSTDPARQASGQEHLVQHTQSAAAVLAQGTSQAFDSQQPALQTVQQDPQQHAAAVTYSSQDPGSAGCYTAAAAEADTQTELYSEAAAFIREALRSLADGTASDAGATQAEMVQASSLFVQALPTQLSGLSDAASTALQAVFSAVFGVFEPSHTEPFAAAGSSPPDSHPDQRIAQLWYSSKQAGMQSMSFEAAADAIVDVLLSHPVSGLLMFHEASHRLSTAIQAVATPHLHDLPSGSIAPGSQAGAHQALETQLLHSCMTLLQLLHSCFAALPRIMTDAHDPEAHDVLEVASQHVLAACHQSLPVLPDLTEVLRESEEALLDSLQQIEANAVSQASL